MSKKYLGVEVRQLAEEMKKLRKGEFFSTDIEKYITRLKDERNYLIKQMKDWCSYLERDINISKMIPSLSVEEAKKREYLSGYTAQDFQLCGMLEIFLKNPAITPPDPDYVGVFIMLLQSAINDLSWAIGELNSYLK